MAKRYKYGVPARKINRWSVTLSLAIIAIVVGLWYFKGPEQIEVQPIDEAVDVLPVTPAPQPIEPVPAEPVIPNEPSVGEPPSPSQPQPVVPEHVEPPVQYQPPPVTVSPPDLEHGTVPKPPKRPRSCKSRLKLDDTVCRDFRPHKDW
jgi:hypothetical protein